MVSSNIRGSGGSSKPTSTASQAKEAPNTLQSKSTARVLDAISEGVIGGLVNGQQSVYLNDTPLQNYDGSFNFQGVTVDSRTGLPTQDAMSGFAYVENEISVGVEVKYATPVVRTINDPNLDAVRVKIRIPALTSQSSNGSVSGSSVPFLIEVQPSGGSYAPITKNYLWKAMTGTQTASHTATGIRVTAQSVLSGLVGTIQSKVFTVNYRRVGAATWTLLGTRTISATIPGVGVNTTGTTTVSATFEASGLPANQYEYQITSGSLASSYEFQETPITISGKTTSPYEVEYRVDLPKGGAPWNVRVSRTTMESIVLTVQDAMFFSSYTEVIDAKLQYPNTAYVGLTVDAQLFGSSVPTRSYEIYGIQIQIPSNYDPVARTYSGIWDGTFVTAYSNNPAWVLYDILTNTRYGLGQDISPDMVDKFALYAIGQYCDELVDDGYGGQEPRFVFNGILNTQKDAYTVINAIASAFRGMTFWSSGSVTATIDSPADPVKLVTPANVVDGIFTYSGSALKARHTAALVTWNDPNDNYKATIEVVEDPDGIRQYGWRQLDTVAYGCTSRGQARRFGLWMLDTERHETEVVTYKAGLDHYDVRPGDIVKISDPAYSDIQFGGRVADTASTGDLQLETGGYLLLENGVAHLIIDGVDTGIVGLVLDREVTLEAGQSYSVSVVMPDGSILDRNITNDPGPTYVLMLDTLLTDTPLPGAMWIITSTSVYPRLFRVIGVKETEKHQWEITALFHDPNKYARVEQGLHLADIPYSLFPTGPIGMATALSVHEFIQQAGPDIRSVATLSWTSAGDTRISFYEVAFQGPNDADYRDYRDVSGTSVDIEGLPLGDYSFRVTSVSSAGVKSQPAYLSYTIQGLAAPPSDVTGFNLNIIGDAAYFTWTPVPDLDIDHYVLKYSTLTSGATWGTSFAAGPVLSKTASSVTLPAQVGSYLIKAVDTSGTESVNAALIETTISGIANYNAVATITDSPTFSGTKTNCAVSSSELQMISADIGNPGLYYFVGSGGATGSSYDLGAVYTSRLTASIECFGSDLLNNVDLWDNIDNVVNWDGADPSKWHVQLQVRTTQTDPTTSPVWSDWQDFNVGDYTARAFQFRLYLYAYQTGITPVITGLSINIDMPDRVLGANNVAGNSAGVSISFSPAFRATPAIAATGQGLSTGDYFRISGQSASGFTIQFFNSSGTGISKNFDWVAKGYGKQS